MSVAYLNGVFSPLEETRISVLDRGFIFGDGVYEVIPVYAGHLFRLDEHLARLENSLAETRIPNPHPPLGWAHLLADLAERNGGHDQAIYFQVTRGVAVRNHAFPAGIAPTVFAMSSPVGNKDEIKPVSAITHPDNRWGRCDIKAISLLPNVLLRQKAVDAGAHESILIRDGAVTEGAASNVFVVRDKFIVTPAKGPWLLAGITRDLVLELCTEAGLPCSEGSISETALREADEVWLTSTTMEIAPVTRLDGVAVGNGKPGLLWKKVRSLFRGYKRQLMEGHS